MAELVQLPSGNTVTLRDPEQTTERQRRPIRTAQTMAGVAAYKLQRVIDGEHVGDISKEQLDTLWEIADAIVMALVESWTFDLPLTVEGFKDIPGEKDAKAIFAACEKHRDALLPDFAVNPDPESPTEPSAA